MYYTKIASAIINDIYSGLRGYHHNLSLSIELLEDEIVAMRLSVLKEYQLKGILPLNDLLHAINCIPVDCKDLERCPECAKYDATPQAHFEIPPLVTDFGLDVIAYLGSPDRQNSFTYYYSSNYTNRFHKYRKRGKNKPYVFIDLAPNEHGMLDCYIFNAPLIKTISIVALFKDMRQLCDYSCVGNLDDMDKMTFIDNEVKDRLTKLKILYYRQLAAPLQPNNLQYT